MDNNNETEYKAVRGLIRGLDVVSALNRLNGRATINQLAEQVSLHRTTVRRLLETLQAEGYVQRCTSDERFYQLNLKVRELSEGFRDEHWISALAAPILGKLLQKVLWPTDICTLDLDAMIVRETTHRFSHLSFHSAMVGRRLPILLTSVGRAYLSFCPDDERESILDLIRAQDTECGAMARDASRMQRLVEHTRKAGYGENYSHWGSEEKIAAIALPIRTGNQVLGCLSLVYVARAMPIKEAAKRYLPQLQEVVDAIEHGLCGGDLTQAIQAG